MRRSSPATRSWRVWVVVRAIAFTITCVLALVTTTALAAPAPANPGPSGSTAPAPSASTAPAPRVVPAEVKVREHVVVVVRVPRGGRSPADRARAANGVIDRLLQHPEQIGDVHAEDLADTVVIYVGTTPILTIGQDDVVAAGEANLHVLSAAIVARAADAFSAERKRSAIATTVFSLSILVFSGLVAFLLLGRVSELSARLRALLDKPEQVSAVRLGNIEFLSAGAARGVLFITLTLGHRVLQLAILYGWLILGLSLFEATRGYTERLTGMIVEPLSRFATRVGGALPVLIMAGVAIVVVTAVLRIVKLFFDSVGRGDTAIGWLPRDLAAPTSLLVRFAIVVASFIVASPLITGTDDGAMSRAGLVALFAVALAATPLLASAAIGLALVFGRRLRAGEHVEVGGRSGRVIESTLIDVHLEDATGCEVRVPHLLGLFHPTRVHGGAPLATVDVVVDPGSSPSAVEQVLLAGARRAGDRARAELVYLDEVGARWRVTSALAGTETISLGRAVAEALAGAGLAFGQRGRADQTVPDDPSVRVKDDKATT